MENDKKDVRIDNKRKQIISGNVYYGEEKLEDLLLELVHDIIQVRPDLLK